MVNPWARGGLAVLGAALLLALALPLAWALTQGPDAEPRPLPPALQRPVAAAPGPVFERLQQLEDGGAAAQAERLARSPLGCGRGEDCAPRWQRETAAIADALAQAGELGARCEALATLQREGQAYAEWLPPRLEPATPLPRFAPLMHCQRWWIGQALVAAGAGDEAAAGAQLQASRDWAVSSLAGARSLIGHVFAYALLQQHLQAVAATAVLQPGWAGALEALVQPWPEGLLRPDRWMPVEAAMARGTVDAADAACHADDAAAVQPLPMDGLARWLCRHRLGWQPEATRQRLDAVWQARAARAAAGPEAWLLAAQAPHAAPEAQAGVWAALAWRNTLGELLVALAADDRLLDGHVARAADVELHRRLLAATLALRRDGVPPAGREAAWAAAGLPPELRARTRWEPAGQALAWRSWSDGCATPGAAGVVPTRIALDVGP
jgi:hypothetical protein